MSRPTARTQTPAARKNLGGIRRRSISGVRTRVRLMISPALAALVWVTPYVSSTSTAAWVEPEQPTDSWVHAG